MNNAIKTDSSDEKVWDHHRPDIDIMYWKHSLSTINTLMKERHGFAARSKSQYERHFKKWHLRKNLTGPEWGIIISYIKRNSICLEQVEVLFRGHEIPPSRITQEIARRSSLLNTSQSGSNRLPKDITLRPPLRAPNMDTSNGLQITQAPAINSSSSFIQPEIDPDLVTITSPLTDSINFNAFTLFAECARPFSWMHSVDLDSISKSLYPAQQLIKWQEPTKMQLDAIFYLMHQSPVDATHGSHDTILPLCAITSLVNNVSLVGGRTITNNAYALLKALPLNLVTRSLESLPTPILDALKERVFATAVKVGDVDLVSAMLKLNVNPGERIMMQWPNDLRPTFPLEFAVAAGHFVVTKILISYMSQIMTQSQLGELLDHVVQGSNLHWHFRGTTRLAQSEIIEMMCSILATGVSPRRQCFGSRFCIFSLKQMIGATTSGIIAWLEAGLLEYHIAKRDGHPSSIELNRLANDVLQLVFYEYQQHLPVEDPRLETSISNALRIAIYQKIEKIVEILLEASSRFGYSPYEETAWARHIGAPGHMDNSILQAFEETDWALAASLTVAQAHSHSSRPNSPDSQIREALKNEDLMLTYDLLRTRNIWSKYGFETFRLAIRLGQIDMAITVIRNMEDGRFGDGSPCLEALLKHGQTTAVSTLLVGHSVWRSALDAASDHKDFDALEAFIYQDSVITFFRDLEVGRCPTHSRTAVQQQLLFRTIAFRAIATNDFKLCTWLFELGMDAGEFLLHDEDNSGQNRCIFSTTPFMYCENADRSCSLFFNNAIPSLLAIAAGQSHIEWMEFLCAAGASVVDSTALLRAISFKAIAATIRLLLDKANTRKLLMKRTYSITALRQAIRYRAFTRVDILCKIVDIDQIEPFLDGFQVKRSESPVSHLGEAIITKDLNMVNFLLKQDANPDACVSFDGLTMLEHIESRIGRVTPLLAAIELQSLPIAKILLKYEAELDYTHRPDILRTPLQRAAELGYFDIVQYLVHKGASIDTIHVYSGGTALQLASMNGFCGIAAFLLERGADPNYPPAKGHGRTAFEAAAEWGHVDTISLLMQYNVNLDLEVGLPPESQYERARRFEEKKGSMASKRFVEHLYRRRSENQDWDDLLALDLI